MPIALIILAAGQGTRMNSGTPKVLHELAGVPLLAHALQSGEALNVAKTVVVVGHGGEQVSAAALALRPDVLVAHQTEQAGTGHAVLAARELLADFDGDIVVLFGDTPFIKPETLASMAATRSDFDVVVLGFQAENPDKYGRLIMQGNNLERIVECKDASVAEKKITFCNGGVQMAAARTMFDLLDSVENNNSSGEIYLTDTVELAVKRGMRATAVPCDESETLGINTRTQLAEAEAAFQTRARADALENGVTMTAADTVFFAMDTHLGRDVIVEPNVVFGAGVTVETGATIKAFSHLEGCHIGAGATVGPYARLRPGAELANNARVGNFVEIKNAEIGEGAKIGHLTYIGDASIGENTNIGAGTITCNYDGVLKHRTEIGKNTFIGSNSMLVAPVTLGDEAYTATGSVITDDVPDGSMAIGRAKQVVKPGLARELFKKLRSAKAKQQKDH